MLRIQRLPVLGLLIVVSPVVIAAACGNGPDAKSPPPSGLASASATSTTIASGKPSTSASTKIAPAPLLGVDETAMDKSVDPCDDFYAYACGGWIKATPIPEDRASWSRSFSVIDERNDLALKAFLEKDADAKSVSSDPYAKKLGDFYAACMDEAAIETSDLAPLKAAFDQIDTIKSGKDVAATVVALYQQGFTPLFTFSSGQDFADATQVIGQLEQDGLGLPDREYYLSKDADKTKIRAQYEEHVGRMFALAGDDVKNAKVVMTVETALAKDSMDRVERRDPYKVYHRMTLTEVKKLAPSFDWEALFDGFGVSKTAPVNVAEPGFFKGLEARIAQVKPAEWKSYLRWSVIHELARALPKRFVDENFRFTSTALTGAKSILPRWKRCVGTTDDSLGEALAQPFVRDYFGAEGKERSQAMVSGIEEAMKRDLDQLTWMDDPTRKAAMAKLGKVNNKIGFPDVWRNYDALTITRDSYATNLLKASAFEEKRQLLKIGKPLDRKEWGMTPPTVNAYYDWNMNEMVFPAGILQPPFFDAKTSLAMNYGAAGMVMGHELTHGFDDEGRQFDGDGNLKEWWSKTVAKDFDKRAACVTKQFDGYVAVDELHVNGKLTLGENIADLGGVKLSYAAFKEARKGVAAESIAGFTEDQQFFISFAQSWCESARDPYKKVLVATDPHSPPKFRVMGPLSNTQAFASAFQCKDTSKMVRPAADRCEIW